MCATSKVPHILWLFPITQACVVSDVQLALELATAHHRISSALERMLSHKGDVTEAKMRQQARLCASLDARLNAAHASIDAACSETHSWLQSTDCVLQALARQLSGMSAPGTACVTLLLSCISPIPVCSNSPTQELLEAMNLKTSPVYSVHSQTYKGSIWWPVCFLLSCASIGFDAAKPPSW